MREYKVSEWWIGNSPPPKRKVGFLTAQQKYARTHRDQINATKRAYRQRKRSEQEQKPRGSRGEQNGRALLNEDQVRAIREEYARKGVSQRALAERFGVKQTTISGIVRREKWAHVQ